MEWEPNIDENGQLQSAFQALDRKNSGMVGGKSAFLFLNQSKLDINILKQVL